MSPCKANTCQTCILPKLHSAGWKNDYIAEKLVLTPGRVIPVWERHFQRAGRRLASAA